MRGLIACPFCREMFEPGEEKDCPVCGVALQRVEKLPKPKVQEEVEPPPPDEETLPFTYWRRGRGALVAVSLIGLVAFMMPWVVETQPEHITLNGPGIASRLGWMWAPAISWIVMIPLVLSRRCVYKMRGARVAVGFLAGMSLLTVLVRVMIVPRSTPLNPVAISWGSGLYLSAAVSLVAVALAFTFGGRIDVLTTKQRREGGETLH